MCYDLAHLIARFIRTGRYLNNTSKNSNFTLILVTAREELEQRDFRVTSGQ